MSFNIKFTHFKNKTTMKRGEKHIFQLKSRRRDILSCTPQRFRSLKFSAKTFLTFRAKTRERRGHRLSQDRFLWLDNDTPGRSLNSDFKHMLGASEKGKVGNECNFASHCCTFSWREKEERAPKSQPTERGGEEAGEREKKEDRRKIFSAQTLAPPTHPPTTTLYTLSRRKERRKGQRERRTLVSGPLSNTCQKRARRRKRGGEKGSRKCRKYFWPTFKLTLRPPPPYHTPYPLTRLIEPFDER